MDLFIDTSIIFKDPFWQKNSAKELLRASSLKRLNIYISDLVLKEMKIGIERQIQDLHQRHEKITSDFNKISDIKSKSTLEKAEIVTKSFDKFYNNLFAKGDIIKLETYYTDFEKIVDRNLHYKKPFARGKNELKDAVIWFNYFKFAKARELENCYLLTKNTRDFTDGEGNLHQDLSEDYDKFQVCTSIEEFLSEKRDLIYKAEGEFKDWLEKNSLTNEKVFHMLLMEVEFQISSFISSTLHNIHTIKINGVDYTNIEIDSYGTQWNKVDGLNIDIVKDFAFVKGKLFFNLTIEVIKKGAKDYFSRIVIDEIEKTGSVEFNFYYDKSKIPKDFEMNKMVIDWV